MNRVLASLIFIAILCSSKFIFADTLSQPDTAQINRWLDLAYKYSESNKDSFFCYIQKAEKKCKKIRCYSNLAKCYLYYASYYRRNDNFKLALAYAHASAKINILLSEYKNLAASYSELGEIYLMNVGNYDSAIVYYNKSYQIYEEINDSLGIAATYFSIMNAYYLSKEYNHAFHIGLKLLQKNEVKTRKNFFANVLNTVGASLSDMGKKKESLPYFFRAAEMYKESNQKIKYSRVLNNIANAYKDLKRYDSSEFFMKQALELKRQTNNPKSLCITLGNYADLLIAQQKTAQAKVLATEMYELSLKHQLDDQYMYANWYLSKIEEKQNNFQKALKYLHVYHNLNDSFNKIENEKSINSLVAQLELSVKDLSLQKLRKEKAINEILLSKKEAELKTKQILIYLYVFIIVVVLFTFGFVHYYIRTKNIRNRSLLEKELLSYKIEALSLQINPHFIFNILNSIQYNIKNNDYEITNKYISMFSRLLRLILDNSQQQSITFLAEIESLKLYVELEQLRLKNKFQFYINKLNQFNPVRYQIPPLLLQPFVENAIWHGFFGNEQINQQCVIEVNLKEENNTLYCEIVDNGVGFDERQKTKEKSLRGIGITKKRLDIYNELNQTSIKINVESLTNHPVYKSGTRVLIEIPAI
ncbi:MAG: tetratricopeptide repeat protein [Bacteroidales bacterium]|nr:tetratricopeptide repeat protein [Bacteroidales bacterium]